MTLKDYIDNVMLGVNVEFAALELDEGTVAMFVNQARKQVFTAICEQYPAVFTVYLNGIAGSSSVVFAIADRFVRETAVVVDPGGGNPLVPARRLSKAEWQMVQTNSFVSPSDTSPVYYLSNLTITLLPAAKDVRCYYVKGTTDLAVLGDAEDVLVVEAQELVIRRAQAYCYEKLAMTDAKDAVQAEYDMQLKQLMDDWGDAENNIRTALSSRTPMQTP